jgi:hypothetical protein
LPLSCTECPEILRTSVYCPKGLCRLVEGSLYWLTQITNAIYGKVKEYQLFSEDYCMRITNSESKTLHNIIILNGTVISVFNLNVNKLNIGQGIPADVESTKKNNLSKTKLFIACYQKRLEIIFAVLSA